MIRTFVDERSSSMDLLARVLHHRRRRPVVEGQQARCPLCERVMVLYVSRSGPRYHCACDERRG
jgi:hypothetical protein